MKHSPAGLALTIAEEAARLVLAGYRSGVRSREKNPRELVTEYDERSEELIRRRLAEHFPGCAIVAEERGGTPAEGATWYVDPLDGTTNFVHGHPFWAVSLGLVENGVPLIGAVVAPCLALAWSGVATDGARRNGEPCKVSATSAIDACLLATGFPAVRDNDPGNNFASFMRVKRKVQGVRRCGAASIDLCLVADGTYDGYWERNLSPWDIAGGAAVVSAAGGSVGLLDGTPWRPEHRDILATNGLIDRELIGLIAGNG
jgi:myo-inositol-1(or 4)-monophosphatase